MRSKSQLVGLSSVAVVTLLAVPASFAHPSATSAPSPAGIGRYDVRDDRRPVIADETEALPLSGPLAVVHDGLYAASGNQVRRYDRREISLPPTSVWSATSAVLALADSPERGHVYVLDRAALTLVDFADDRPPVALWSYPVDGSPQSASPGRLLARDGNDVYVSDASLPGLRVISLDAEGHPTTVATYVSPDGSIRDLSLCGRSLVLAADSGVVVVEIEQGDVPALRRLGARATARPVARVDADSKRAVVAGAHDLQVVDVDPASPGFLGEPAETWSATSAVRSVKLDAGGNAYVLTNDAIEIVELQSLHAR